MGQWQRIYRRSARRPVCQSYDIIATNDRLSDHRHPTRSLQPIAPRQGWDNGGSGDPHGQYAPGAGCHRWPRWCLASGRLSARRWATTCSLVSYFPAAPAGDESDELKTALVKGVTTSDSLSELVAWRYVSKAVYSVPNASVNRQYGEGAKPPASKLHRDVRAPRPWATVMASFILRLLQHSTFLARPHWYSRQRLSQEGQLGCNHPNQSRKVLKLWVASPGTHAGAVAELSFPEQIGQSAYLYGFLPGMLDDGVRSWKARARFILTGGAVKERWVWSLRPIASHVPLNQASGQQQHLRHHRYIWKGHELSTFTGSVQWSEDCARAIARSARIINLNLPYSGWLTSPLLATITRFVCWGSGLLRHSTNINPG